MNLNPILSLIYFSSLFLANPLAYSETRFKDPEPTSEASDNMRDIEYEADTGGGTYSGKLQVEIVNSTLVIRNFNKPNGFVLSSGTVDTLSSMPSEVDLLVKIETSNDEIFVAPLHSLFTREETIFDLPSNFSNAKVTIIANYDSDEPKSLKPFELKDPSPIPHRPTASVTSLREDYFLAIEEAADDAEAAQSQEGEENANEDELVSQRARILIPQDWKAQFENPTSTARSFYQLRKDSLSPKGYFRFQLNGNKIEVSHYDVTGFRLNSSLGSTEIPQYAPMVTLTDPITGNSFILHIQDLLTRQQNTFTLPEHYSWLEIKVSTRDAPRIWNTPIQRHHVVKNLKEADDKIRATSTFLDTVEVSTHEETITVLSSDEQYDSIIDLSDQESGVNYHVKDGTTRVKGFLSVRRTSDGKITFRNFEQNGMTVHQKFAEGHATRPSYGFSVSVIAGGQAANRIEFTPDMFTKEGSLTLELDQEYADQSLLFTFSHQSIMHQNVKFDNRQARFPGSEELVCQLSFMPELNVDVK